MTLRLIQPAFTEAEARAVDLACQLALAMQSGNTLGVQIAAGALANMEDAEMRLIAAGGKLTRGIEARESN